MSVCWTKSEEAKYGSLQVSMRKQILAPTFTTLIQTHLTGSIILFIVQYSPIIEDAECPNFFSIIFV